MARVRELRNLGFPIETPRRIGERVKVMNNYFTFLCKGLIRGARWRV